MRAGTYHRALVDDIVFGARRALEVERRFAEGLFQRWGLGRSSRHRMNVYHGAWWLLCTGMAHLGHVAFGKTLQPQHPADRSHPRRPADGRPSDDGKRFWRRSR